ncbi:MAG: hypothetical protein JXR94_12960 [Candidatus Hydrogenedentes bacterium]|nr:hypothetical protein [Candidatus Hydrogenedentota bacterium]
MPVRLLTGVLTLACMLGLCGLCAAQDGGDVEALEEQVRQLQQQLDEMRAQHAAEIQALTDKVNALAGAMSATAPAAEAPQDELAALRALAEAEAGQAPVEEAEPEDVLFKAGGLSLQALNPEISVTGDMIATYRHQRADTDSWRADFRGLGLHFESYLDPYTRFKAAVSVNEDEAKLGEAYMTRFGIFDNLNLTLGKFRQQFGVVNRWHKHGLDQVDFPLALRRIFGNGGLNQTGLSLEWNLPPLGAASQELTFQLTNGENERLFGDNSWDTPAILLHYKNFRDLTENTYLEFGATSLLGWNDEWNVHKEQYEGGQSYDLWLTEHDRLPSWVFGGDLSLRWEPTDRMRYRNLEWRTEAYLLDRKIRDPFTHEGDHVVAWGAYSYLQAKLSRTWEAGLRLDYYQPDYKPYAGLAPVSLTPLAYPERGAYRWQAGPYVTWHQSPFVRYRLEYNHEDGHGMEDAEDRILLQMIFAAGPHKHERY